MKIMFKVREDYIPRTDIAFVRLSVILLEHSSEDLYNPVKKFCIDFEKNKTFESEDVVNKLRAFADRIENGS